MPRRGMYIPLRTQQRKRQQSPIDGVGLHVTNCTTWSRALIERFRRRQRTAQCEFRIKGDLCVSKATSLGLFFVVVLFPTLLRLPYGGGAAPIPTTPSTAPRTTSAVPTPGPVPIPRPISAPPPPPELVAMPTHSAGTRGSNTRWVSAQQWAQLCARDPTQDPSKRTLLIGSSSIGESQLPAEWRRMRLEGRRLDLD